jgi:hypothetical protein
VEEPDCTKAELVGLRDQWLETGEWPLSVEEPLSKDSFASTHDPAAALALNEEGEGSEEDE